MGYSDSAFPYKITPEFRKYQKRVFFITVLLYCSFHSSRTAWAYVKVSVTEDSYYTDKMIGIFDMCFMIAYASGLFISGWIGDRSNLKNFLAIGAIISVAGFITFSTAANTVHSVIFGSFCFLLNGFGQSRVMWPEWEGRINGKLFFFLKRRPLKKANFNIFTTLIGVPWQYVNIRELV